MDVVIIVTILAILQFYWFGIEVGNMRAKHQCKAPAITGAPEFERMFRVQQNTMEQLLMFLPALWLFAEAGAFCVRLHTVTKFSIADTAGTTTSHRAATCCRVAYGGCR